MTESKAKRRVNRMPAQKGPAGKAGQLNLYRHIQLRAGEALPGDHLHVIYLQFFSDNGSLTAEYPLGSAVVSNMAINEGLPQHSSHQLSGPSTAAGTVSLAEFTLSLRPNPADPPNALADGHIALHFQLTDMPLALDADSKGMMAMESFQLGLTQMHQLSLVVGADSGGMDQLQLSAHLPEQVNNELYELDNIGLGSSYWNMPQSGSRFCPEVKATSYGMLQQVDYTLWLQEAAMHKNAVAASGSLRLSWTIGGLDFITKDVKRHKQFRRKPA